MLTDLHERLPTKIRRGAPQWVKILYAKASLYLKQAYVKLHFWIDDEVVDSWFQDKEVFFILSIGRSGTEFLATLLNKDPKALVVHEPFIEAIPHQEAFHDSRKAEDYIINFRKKEIYLRIHKLDIEVYGEVNSFLRRHCYALKKAFPRVKLIHLVRDGRDVVRSMYARETMTPKAYDTKMIYPSKDDPFRNRWNEMSRFEKLCWYWMIENKFLRECIGGSPVQFEKVISDYSYFKEALLEPLGLNIPKEIWEREVKKPRNITMKHKLPHWRKWDRRMREIFEEICGEEMEKLEYKLEW